MSKVVFELSNGVDGEIVLREGDFMEFWKFVFKRNNTQLGPRSDKNCNSIFVDVPEQESQRYQTELWSSTLDARISHAQRVNTAIDNLLEMGFAWSSGRADQHSHNTECNRIHRAFTTSMLSRSTDDFGLSREKLIEIKHRQPNFNHGDALYFLNFIVENFELIDFNSNKFDLYQRAVPQLHEINAYIHKIEDGSIASDRSYLIAKTHLQSVNRLAGWWPNLDWNSKKDDGCTDSSRIDFNFADLRTMDTSIYSSDPQYNVYDLKNILGKDYETAWLNYDDPVNWDVTNTFNTTKGGFEIKPYQSQWTNQYIKPWAASYGVPAEDNIVAPISIGSISEQWLHEHCYTDQPQTLEQKAQQRIVRVDLIE